MKKKIYFLLVIISFSLVTLGQNKDISKIFIRATTEVAGREYFIYILTGNDSTKVIFKLKERVLQSQLEADTNTNVYTQMIKSVRNFTPDNDTVRTYLHKLDSLYTAYTLYSNDSIIVANSKDEDYINLIQEVLISPSEVLENKSHFVLDGTTMTFMLTKSNVTRTVYAHSPTPTSNPLLYRLITETTELYRRNKGNNFLTKSRTSGY